MKDIFSSDTHLINILKLLMQHTQMYLFTYSQRTDEMNVYDASLKNIDIISGVLRNTARVSLVHRDDFWKLQELLEEKIPGPVEIRVKKTPEREYHNISIDTLPKGTDSILLGSMRNITKVRKKEQILQEKAQKDSLTGLYNQQTGKILISEYLSEKDPYSSCGMMVIDMDYFKNINDNYGHLFGNEVLTRFAEFMRTFFRSKDILVRAGGDEFVVFLKEISHQDLIKKSMNFIHMIRKLKFSKPEFFITCSVGICYLPENIAGYSYDQLFENADWALYQAKIHGRNRYVFCDNLRRFELKSPAPEAEDSIDSRYLRNDIIATAFELFEKQNSFDSALEMLLKVIGIRFQLDRVTIMQTDLQTKNTSRQYQWLRENIPPVLNEPVVFAEDDFLTLFRSYDEYGTTVLQHNNMNMYSEGAQKLLMQGGARTVLYAAMYCEGKYTGAISYVVCSATRFWSKQDRKQLGELSKIISAHMSKRYAFNSVNPTVSAPGYDPLTGLLSFARFKEETERIIVGGYADSYFMIYTDFRNFKYFNQKYGYTAGDQVLKEFSNYILTTMPADANGYFTRVVADQFILFMRFTKTARSAQIIHDINRKFADMTETMFPGSDLKLRTGIYQIMPDCLSSSVAIDAANHARKQIREEDPEQVCFYSPEQES